MQYQVLARKWRPQNFHELVGQDHVSRTLQNALQTGRVAHAFLFSGPRGSGKTSAARILAKALNCHEGKPGEPCGKCAACTEIAAGNCMDVLEIDAASNRGIDEIRELKEKVRYNPARDRNKIFIIDEVHMLTSEAFNALLKTLEEPPPHVVFILATTEYQKIPATILSRCQQHGFRLIQYPLILGRLREISNAEGIQISDSALEQVVFSGGGSMRDAMSALDQVIAFCGNQVRDEDVTALLGLVEPKVLRRAVQAVAEDDSPTLLGIVGDLVESGQDLHSFCRRFSGHLRNLMVLKAGIADPALLGVPGSLLPDLRQQAELFSREDLLRLFDSFQKIESGMKYATQARFHLEMGLIELAHVGKLRSLEEVLAELASLAEGNSPRHPEGPPGPPAGSSTPGTPRGTGRNTVSKRTEHSAGRTSVKEPENTASAGTRAAGGSETSSPVQDPRAFLLRIAGAVGRESIESLLQSLEGARLRGDRLVLETGAASDFVRRQIKENLSTIAQAAARITASKVTVVLEEGESREASEQQSKSDAPPESEILEKAKREPVIKSFLDVFPGPVKAEKIDK